jgi:hypothetical protein
MLSCAYKMSSFIFYCSPFSRLKTINAKEALIKCFHRRARATAMDGGSAGIAGANGSEYQHPANNFFDWILAYARTTDY